MIAQQLSIFDLTITSPSVPQNESNNETRNEEWGNPDFLLQRLVYPNQKRAARLRELADNMQATIDYKKNSAITTQRPTARRLEIAHSMAEEGERLEKVQCWLYGLADAAESGDEPAVTQGITNRRQLEIFSFFDCENWSDQNIEKVFTSNNEKEWLKSLTSAKIHSLSQAKTTLAALNSLSNFKPADDPTELKIAKKERELVGSKIPGYFPTPSEVCDHMVQLAKIQPGQIALEPSAGKGCISEALRRVGAKLARRRSVVRTLYRTRK